MIRTIIQPVRHGLILSTLALILGALWAAYLAVNHERLHSGFEKQEAALKRAYRQQNAPDMAAMMLGVLPQTILRAEAHGNETHPSPRTGHADHEHVQAAPGQQHTHSGSLATDAMRRLLRGHIHWMGLGTLSAVLLLITAFTSLKDGWKKLLGWTFGIGTLAYPPAWILMGFRTVELGPEAAEASVMWLFAPAVGLLLASMTAVLFVLITELLGLNNRLRLLDIFFTNREE